MADNIFDEILGMPSAPSPMDTTAVTPTTGPSLLDLALATRQAGLPAGVEGLLAKQLVDAEAGRSRFGISSLPEPVATTPSLTAAEPESFFAPAQRQAGAFGRSLLDALTFGFGNEARAGLKSLFRGDEYIPIGGSPYDQALREEQLLAEQAAQEAPQASTLGTIAGLFGPAVVARVLRGGGAATALEAGAAAPSASLASKTDQILSKYYLGQTAAAQPTLKELAQIGAVQGALSGAGAAEPLPGQEDTLMTRARGAVGGGLTGALMTPALSKGLEAGIRGPAAAKSALQDILPASPLEEERLVGNLLRATGVREPEIVVGLRRLQETDNPLLPLPYEKIVPVGEQLPLFTGTTQETAKEWARKDFLSTITLGELTGNPNVMRLEEFAKQGKGIAASEFSRSIENANSAIKTHLDKIVKSGTPDEVYKAAKDSVTLIREAHTNALEQSKTLYDAFHTIAKKTEADIPVKVFQMVQSDKARLLGGLDRQVVTAIGALEDIAQTRVPTVEDIWQARSTILAIAKEEKDSIKGKFYGDLAKQLETSIVKSPARDSFSEAEKFYTDTILSRFAENKGLPSELLAQQYVGKQKTDYKIVSPDEIQKKLNENRTAMAAAANVLEGSKESKKLLNNLLQQKFSEFDALGTDWSARRNWIANNRSAFDGTDLRKSWKTTLDKADAYLQDVDELLTYKTRPAPAIRGKVDNLNLENADEAILAGEILEGTANSAGRAAIRQFLRDRTRQVIGRGLSSTQIGGGAVGVGLLGFATDNLLKGLTAGTALLALQPATNYLRSRLNTRVDRLNARLVRALTDPRYALDVLRSSAIENEKRALQPQRMNELVGTVQQALGIPGGRLAASLGSEIVGNALMPSAPAAKPAAPSAPTPAPIRSAPADNVFDKILGAASEAIIPKAEASPRKKPANSSIVQPGKKNQAEMEELSKYDPLTQAVAMAESRGRQSARSAAGAIGVMQLMPKSAKALGVDPRKMKENIAGGAKYLKQLQNRFGDRDLAIAAYNMGETRLARLMRLHDATTWQDLVAKADRLSKSNPDGVPGETIAYVRTVLGFLGRGGK